MAKNLYFTKEHEQVRLAVRDFIKKEINPYCDEWEAAGFSPLHDLFKKMGDLGFLGIRYDAKWGGEGLDDWYELAFLEELGRIESDGVAMAITVQTHMATPAIHQFGSDYLKDTYLKPAIAGDMVSAIAVTEPDAGSDVSALKTTARREGDHYIINGSKTFITNGVQADFLTLLARTDDDPGYHSLQVLQHRIAQWLTETEALKQLTYHIVRMKMAGQDATREISMGKLLAGQLAGKVTDGCLQMHGGYGFMNDMKISRYFRDSRLTAIGGGANEVMSDIICKMEGLQN
jgi:alkylation response protein AidB-like acyl-CoA dehydrogenase